MVMIISSLVSSRLFYYSPFSSGFADFLGVVSFMTDLIFLAFPCSLKLL